MRVYFFECNVGRYDALYPASDDARHTLMNLQYREHGEPWEGVKLRVEKFSGVMGDFAAPWGNCPVFSPRAWEYLEPHLVGPVEALPITVRRKPMVLVNVSKADVLYKSKSQIERRSSGSISDIRRYVWKPAVAKQVLFRMDLEYSRVFATERFRQLVTEYGLVGMSWNETFA